MNFFEELPFENIYGVFGWDNSREWFIYLENLKFFVMKCFVWIEKLKSI